MLFLQGGLAKAAAGSNLKSMENMDQLITTCFDLFGTVIFAITGAARGVKAKLDLLGVIVLSCTVGVGGGFIRDALIGATPAAALVNENYLVLCVITGVVVFIFAKRVVYASSTIITVCDAIGLGVYTVFGVNKGMLYGLSPIGVVLSGVVTAVGGGVLRDLMVGEIPVVLKSDFYATASLIGGALYIFASMTCLPFLVQFLSVSLFVTAIRLLAYHYKLQLPHPGDE